MKKGIVYKTILVLIYVSISLGILITAINYRIIYVGNNNIINTDAVNHKTAIVLGAYVSPQGVLCDMLKDRVVTAVDLYKSGKVKKLLMTGDHGKKNYDEVNSMRKYAESLGVRTEDIFMDHAGFSTYESMYRAKSIFKVDSAVIVTQKFHLPRAVYTARELGIDAKGVTADKYIYYGAEIYSIREVLARVKAFSQINVTHSKPTFLGPEIPINGDGRATHDGN